MVMSIATMGANRPTCSFGEGALPTTKSRETAVVVPVGGIEHAADGPEPRVVGHASPPRASVREFACATQGCCWPRANACALHNKTSIGRNWLKLEFPMLGSDQGKATS